MFLLPCPIRLSRFGKMCQNNFEIIVYTLAFIGIIFVPRLNSIEDIPVLVNWQTFLDDIISI